MRHPLALLILALLGAPALPASAARARAPRSRSSAATRSQRAAVSKRESPRTADRAGTSSASAAAGEREEGARRAPGEGAPVSHGPTRIDFDDRLIQGQTNKSGAVYLYDRKELPMRSMVRKRDSFREQIVSVLNER